MRPSLDIVEGVVSPDDEQIVFSYGVLNTRQPPFGIVFRPIPLPIVAKVSAPCNGVLTLSLLVDDSTARGREIIADVRRKVQWLFVEKGEANPWVYAKYHCTTAANAYGNVHGGWVPATN